MLGVVGYAASVIQTGKRKADLIVMASFLVIVLVKRKLLTSKWILLLSFSLWVYYYTRTIFAREDDIFTNPVQTTYILGYNWGIMHILAQKAFPNIILQMAFEIIVFILRMVVFVDGLSTQQLINHILVNLFLLSSNFWTDSQNRKYYKETFKFKEFMAKHLSSALIVLDELGQNVLFINETFQKCFEEQSKQTALQKLDKILLDQQFIEEVEVLTSTETKHNEEASVKAYFKRQIQKNDVVSQPKNCFYINSKSEKKLYEAKLTKIAWDGEDAYALLFNDISHQEAILSLKLANQNQEKALAIVAHELRNPINGLLGVTKLMEQQSNNNPSLLKSISLIKVNINIILNVLNSILDIEQLKQNKLKINPIRVKDRKSVV